MIQPKKVAVAEIKHLALPALEAGLGHIRQSPRSQGELQLIVRRPDTLGRELLDEGELNFEEGLAGDNWSVKASSRTSDNTPHLDMQLTIINSRAIDLVAQSKERWPLAGDQLYIDLDLSKQNLPAHTRIKLGSAVIEVTEQPHTGCQKFIDRYGLAAMKFVNSKVGRELNLRGVNAKVIQPGVIKVGDMATIESRPKKN